MCWFYCTGDTAALEAAIKRQQSGRYPPIDEYRDKTSGNNALMEAASKGHYECVNELLAAGADVYETNRVSKKSVSAIAKESANVQITSVIDGEVAFQNWLGEEVEEGQPSHLPGKYKCSITQDLMYVPVYVPANKEHPRDSDSYERWAVLKWLQTNRELPNDRRKVSKEDLVVNTELIEEIKVFRQKWLDANTNMSATGAAQKALLQHKQKPHKGKQ